MSHRQRVIPKRMWDRDFGEYTGHPDDPRTDDRDGSEIYADELMLAEFRKDMRLARERQENTK